MPPLQITLKTCGDSGVGCAFVEIESSLERASRMLTRWEKIVVDLCNFQWQEDSRSFDQAEVTETVSKCRRQRNRIDELKESRGIGDQAIRLLAKERGEHMALELDNLFLPFLTLLPSMLQGLDISPGSEALWTRL